LGNILRSLLWVKHNIFIDTFDSKLGEVGNDGAPFSWKMDDDDKTKLNRLVVAIYLARVNFWTYELFH
jgi:hypothetical protein